ncbi:MAG: hypothetical protein HDR04_15370 [Lachnospiraceae bacterium]|nr:hypothetical protein [Lachnospiraceae bacterium]
MEPEENVFKSIWREYERVIIESLVTSFGLDFIVGDQYGGDVDTIHNVRRMQEDTNLLYKNKSNEAAYMNRGAYNTAEYHGDQSFRHVKAEARKEFFEQGKSIDDVYTGEKIVPVNKGQSREKQAQLDHVISAKQIHDDRGRILAELSGKDLANNPDNLRFTNACLNNNMRDKSIPDYIRWCEENPDKVNWGGEKGKPLPDSVKQELLGEYNKSQKIYDQKINYAYYTSKKFVKDTAMAAGKRATQMGMRQALGFVFLEIWFAVKEEMEQIPTGFRLEEVSDSIVNGVKKGITNAKNKYRELLVKLEEGLAAGVLTSLTTTICNIFTTTLKNIVKCIRQVYASLVQAGKVLLFNPDNLMLGDRIKTATIIIATGASVLLGTAVGEIIGDTPIGKTPIGGIVATFCSTMVSGTLSCTLLIALDRSTFMKKIIDMLNTMPNEVNNYAEIATYMERLAAKYAKIDIESFRKETGKYKETAIKISATTSEEELTFVLEKAYVLFEIELPWKGDFNEFMSNRDNKLVFE